MASTWYRASAPSSSRLMGEHAVLRGGPALVFALNKRIVVAVRERKDECIQIASQFGTESVARKDLSRQGPHSFVKAAILAMPECTSGLDVEVVSTFSHTMGLGSSAAVTVATLGAISELVFRCVYSSGMKNRNLPKPTPEIETVRSSPGCYLDDGAAFQGQDVGAGKTDSPFPSCINPSVCLQRAQSAIRSVQGVGSGADAAASCYGGVLLFYAEGCRVERLCDRLPLHLAYCGMKTPTQEVVQTLARREQQDPNTFQEIFSLINGTTEKAVQAIRKMDLNCFGECMNVAHGFMVALGLENGPLAYLRGQLLNEKAVLGCKIAGSGLGDCVVALAENFTTTLCLPVECEAQGVRKEL